MVLWKKPQATPGSTNVKSTRRREGGRVWLDRWLHPLALVLMIAAGIVMAITQAPNATPLKNNPGFLDVVFNSRLVVLAARIVIVDGAIYILASLVARTAAKEWARKAGPVESGDDPADDAQAAIKTLETDWPQAALDAREEIGGLKERLTATQEVAESAVRELEALEGRAQTRVDTAKKG